MLRPLATSPSVRSRHTHPVPSALPFSSVIFALLATPVAPLQASVHHTARRSLDVGELEGSALPSSSLPSSPFSSSSFSSSSSSVPLTSEWEELRTRARLAEGWKFWRESFEAAPFGCGSENGGAFTVGLAGRLCEGLDHLPYVSSTSECRRDCCSDAECNVWMWANASRSCYTGQVESFESCKKAEGHIGEGRLHVNVQTGSLLRSTSSLLLNDLPPEALENFQDDTWRNVRIPHDFGVEGKFDRLGDRLRGYLPYGKAWYRLRFSLPESMRGRSIWFDFDGTYRDAHVWLNQVKLGEHASGYTPYRFEVGAGSDYDAESLHFGNERSNVLVVLLDSSKPEGWWYDGGGIYRHVWLNSASAIHVEPSGVYIPSVVNRTTIKESSRGVQAEADIAVLTRVKNSGMSMGEVYVVSTVLDPSTKKVIATSKGGKNSSVKIQGKRAQEVKHLFNATSVLLWSLENPKLYTLVSEIIDKETEKVLDSVRTTFGVRATRWDPKRGFFLNERPLKIKGAANHQDFAGVGAAVPDAIQTFRVMKLKEMGANAWRTAHNAPNSALLDATDRLGMLVMDENHMNDLSAQEDVKALILRDRNHPSVIMWSICNEGVLCENFNGETAHALKQTIARHDPFGERLVTAAMNFAFEERPDFVGPLDIVGINYNIDSYDGFHARHPQKPLIASETSSDTGDRGIYANDRGGQNYVSAFDGNFPVGGSSAQDAWCPIAQRPFIAGGFIWTGFDYRGEPTPYGWPNVKSHFGAIDMAGFEKDNFHYYRSVWKPEEPMLHIFPHWDWSVETCKGACRVEKDNNGKVRMVVNVWAYTTGDFVDLYLNGRPVGRRMVPVNQIRDSDESSEKSLKCRHIEWNVTYEPGTLDGIARLNFSSDLMFARTMQRTSSGSHRVELKLDSPVLSRNIVSNRTSSSIVGCVALVRAQIVDKNGVVVPRANHSLRFSVGSDTVRIIGLGNGDPSSHEPNKPLTPLKGNVKAFNGLARVILEVIKDPPSGTATHANELLLGAKADGLIGADLRVDLSAMRQMVMC